MICVFVASKIITILTQQYFPLYFLNTLKMNEVNITTLDNLTCMYTLSFCLTAFLDQHSYWSSCLVHQQCHYDHICEIFEQKAGRKGIHTQCGIIIKSQIKYNSLPGPIFYRLCTSQVLWLYGDLCK